MELRYVFALLLDPLKHSQRIPMMFALLVSTFFFVASLLIMIGPASFSMGDMILDFVVSHKDVFEWANGIADAHLSLMYFAATLGLWLSHALVSRFLFPRFGRYLSFGRKMICATAFIFFSHIMFFLAYIIRTDKADAGTAAFVLSGFCVIFIAVTLYGIAINESIVRLQRKLTTSS